MLCTGIRWEFLPQELGFGSGPTCWRRLAEWQRAGVWDELQQVLLDKLRRADQLTFPVPSWTLPGCGWVAEAAIAWLHGPRTLRTRWESRDDIHEGFLRIAHCMILAGKLPATAF